MTVPSTPDSSSSPNTLEGAAGEREEQTRLKMNYHIAYRHHLLVLILVAMVQA